MVMSQIAIGEEISNRYCVISTEEQDRFSFVLLGCVCFFLGFFCLFCFGTVTSHIARGRDQFNERRAKSKRGMAHPGRGGL